jgi:hypothetical protein
MSCPTGFEQGAQSTCHIVCPSDFIYVQESGAEKCKLVSDPSKSVTLNALPINPTQVQTTTEQSRVTVALEAIRLLAASTASTRQSLLDAQSQSSEWVQQHNTLESRYAEFAGTGEALDTTNKALKPKRPPTAPVDDLSRERQLILQGPGIDVLLIQIALFLAVLSMLSFLVLPRDSAQGLSFLLLCTGVAIGFFLRK